MRILNQINYIGGLGADRWIGSGWKEAFEELGHEFFWYTATDNLEARIKEVRPDIIMTSQSELGNGKLAVFLASRRRGVKVVMRVDSFFDHNPVMRDALVRENPADIYFGEVEGSRMDIFKKMTGKSYVIIANAANHRTHFPTAPVSKYACDIVFLGAWMPKKREAFSKLLFPLMKKYRVRLYGPNWTFKDNVLRSLGLIVRKVGMSVLNERLQQLRLSIPVDEENQLYASAKICINIHERGENINIQDHLILNERTFKIPACGGFEICDFVPPLRRYFTEDEMVMADEKNGNWVDDWFEKIDYYVTHEADRKLIQTKGTERALRDHTYLNRMRQILELLGLSQK